MKMERMPRVTAGKVEGASFEELLLLASGAVELDFRSDMDRVDASSIPGLPAAHPSVEAVALTCDPVLGNVMVAPGATSFSYDRRSGELTVRYEREAFCAEAASGAVVASSASVRGWVKVRRGADGAFKVTRSSKPTGRSALVGSGSACVGGTWPAGTDSGAALALLLATSAAVSVERGGGRNVETVVRPDACAQGPDTLRARYAFKHAILDYGGFEAAEREEPGLIADVFSDRRMWLWSFTEAPPGVWGGEGLLEGFPVYGTGPAAGGR